MAEFRGGAFGSPSLTGPFSVNSELSRYNIGETETDLAYLEKLKASHAWQNGQLSDEAYLAALRTYANATDPGTSRRQSAENEVENATYSIGRNRIVHQINDAATPAQKVQALLRLVRFDRARLRTMTGNSEARREQVQRVQSSQAEIRSVRWGQQSDRFNRGQMSLEQIRRQAVKLRREARGAPDQQKYTDEIQQIDDAIATQRINEAQAAWYDSPSDELAARVDSLLQDRQRGMSKQSPQYQELKEAREKWAEETQAYKTQLRDAKVDSRYRRGMMSDDEYLDELLKRMKREKPGTPDYFRKRDDFLLSSFDLSAKRARSEVAAGLRPVTDLIGLLESSLGVLNLDSQAFLDTQAEINALRTNGLESIDIMVAGSNGAIGTGQSGIGYGHYVYPGSLAPGGRPVNKQGFASQFDGSTFANTNCGMAAAAMLAWDVSGGKVRVSGGDMRYYSGDRAGGTWTDDVVRSMGAVGIGARAMNIGLANFRKRVGKGQPAVLTGTSGMLPPEFRFGYNGAHSVFVARTKKEKGIQWYFVMDPLGRAGYRGDWWTEEMLYNFGWVGNPGTNKTGANVVFAGKSGNLKVEKDAPLPPTQAFDTDFDGNSTIGRGGGTNREEAGPPRDWSEGKPVHRASDVPLSGMDQETVVAFLESVAAMEEHGEKAVGPYDISPGDTLEDDEGLAARMQRAAGLLAKYGGDPRLAGAEWFTGREATFDTAEWTQAMLWAGNAIGVAMGWDKLKHGDQVTTAAIGPVEQPAAPQAPYRPGDATEGVDEVTPGVTPSGAPVTAVVAPGTLGLDEATEDFARGILARLGVAPSEGAIRSVAAWIAAENPDGSIDGYNPLNLRTASGHHFDGQIGVTDEGIANFASLEAGLDAAAEAIKADAPGIIGPLRTGSPEAVMSALSQAGWAGVTDYGAVVTQAYNQQPSVPLLITNTGTSAFTKPDSLVQLSRQNPEFDDMLDVDPRDPMQMAWWERNAKAVIDGWSDGTGTFDFIRPGGGMVRDVALNEGIVRDILGINLDYTLASIDPALPMSEQTARLDEAYTAYYASTDDLDFERNKAHIATMIEQRDIAFARGSQDDLITAMILEDKIAQAVNIGLGLGPFDTPDARSENNPYLDDEERSWYAGIIEGNEPLDTDEGSPNYAPNGSVYAMLRAKGMLRFIYGAASATTPSGAPILTDRPVVGVEQTVDMFFEQEDGKIVPHWKGEELDPTKDPFALVPEQIGTNPDGSPVMADVPRYASQQEGRVTVSINGMTFHQKPQPVADGRFVIYHRELTGASAGAQGGSAGADFAEMLAQGVGAQAGMAATGLGVAGAAMAAPFAAGAAMVGGAAQVAGVDVQGGLQDAQRALQGLQGGLQGGMNDVSQWWDTVTGPSGQFGEPAEGSKLVEPDPRDGLITLMPGVFQPGREAGQFPVWQMRFKDERSGQWITWLSFDDPATAVQQSWIGWVGDEAGALPPGIVITDPNTSVSYSPNGEPVLMVGGEAYNQADHGAVSQYIKSYGDPSLGPEWRTPSDQGGVGRPDREFLFRSTLSTDTERALLFSDLSYTERYKSGILDTDNPVEVAALRTEIFDARAASDRDAAIWEEQRMTGIGIPQTGQGVDGELAQRLDALGPMSVGDAIKTHGLRFNLALQKWTGAYTPGGRGLFAGVRTESQVAAIENSVRETQMAVRAREAQEARRLELMEVRQQAQQAKSNAFINQRGYDPSVESASTLMGLNQSEKQAVIERQREHYGYKSEGGIKIDAPGVKIRIGGEEKRPNLPTSTEGVVVHRNGDVTTPQDRGPGGYR